MQGSAGALLGLAKVAGAQERFVRAAQLYGAAEAVFSSSVAQIDSGRRAEYEQDLAARRVKLAASTYASAWAQGRAMALEQAIAYALEDDLTAD